MAKLIGTDFNFHHALRAIDACPAQQELRARNEARLAALRAGGTLTEGPRGVPAPPEPRVPIGHRAP